MHVHSDALGTHRGVFFVHKSIDISFRVVYYGSITKGKGYHMVLTFIMQSLFVVALPFLAYAIYKEGEKLL